MNTTEQIGVQYLTKGDKKEGKKNTNDSINTPIRVISN